RSGESHDYAATVTRIAFAFNVLPMLQPIDDDRHAAAAESRQMRQVAGRGGSEEIEQVEDLVVDRVDAEPIRQLLIEQDCLREKVARFSYQGFAHCASAGRHRRFSSFG